MVDFKPSVFRGNLYAVEDAALNIEQNKQLLDAILNELDEWAERQTTGLPVTKTEERRCRRQPFRVTCKIRFLAPGQHQVLDITGRTRNLSRGGFSFMSKRMFSAREPVELEVELPGRPITYITGAVCFCRYVAKGYYETGAEMKVMANRSHLAGQIREMCASPTGIV